MKLSDIPGAGFIYNEGPRHHVFPLYGRTHVCSMECWCNPKPLEDEPSVILHEPDN